MSISTINSALQNQYASISTQAVKNTASSNLIDTSNEKNVTTDTVSISAAGQALSNAASASKVIGAYSASDYPDQLTEDDKKVIASFPSDEPYNLLRNSIAFAVEVARKSGELKGPLTLEALLGNSTDQGGLIADLPLDVRSKIPMLALKKVMANGATAIKNSSADELAKIISDAFQSSDQLQTSISQTNKAKFMMRDYGA
jgi:hypothetical protein